MFTVVKTVGFEFYLQIVRRQVEDMMSPWAISRTS